VFGDSTLSGNATVTGELYTKGRLVGATSTSGCFYTMPTPANTPTQTVNYSIQTGFTAKHIELYWVGTFDETTYNSTMMFENGTTFTGHFGEVEVGNAGATTLTTFASTTPMLYDFSGTYWYGTVSISESTTTGFNVQIGVTQHVSTGSFNTAPIFCYYARP
jgi:hypothetical protein